MRLRALSRVAPLSNTERELMFRMGWGKLGDAPPHPGALGSCRDSNPRAWGCGGGQAGESLPRISTRHRPGHPPPLAPFGGPFAGSGVGGEPCPADSPTALADTDVSFSVSLKSIKLKKKKKRLGLPRGEPLTHNCPHGRTTPVIT